MLRNETVHSRHFISNVPGYRIMTPPVGWLRKSQKTSMSGTGSRGQGATLQKYVFTTTNTCLCSCGFVICCDYVCLSDQHDPSGVAAEAQAGCRPAQRGSAAPVIVQTHVSFSLQVQRSHEIETDSSLVCSNSEVPTEVTRVSFFVIHSVSHGLKKVSLVSPEPFDDLSAASSECSQKLTEDRISSMTC